MKLKAYIDIALAEIAADKVRSVIVVVGIALGVTLMTGIRLVNQAVVEHFSASIDRVAGPIELQVISEGGEQGVDPDLAVEIANVPIVFAAMPVIDRTVPLKGTENYVRLFATDLLNDRVRQTYEVSLEGVDDPFDLISRPRTVVTNSDLRVVGESLSVVGPSGATHLNIVGRVKRDAFLGVPGTELAIADLSVVQELLHIDTVVDRIDVVLVDGQDVDAARSQIAEILPPGNAVVSPLGRGTYFEETIQSFQITIQAFGFLALITAAFVVYSAVSTAVKRRLDRIATWRALGMRRRGVVALFAIEAMFLGVVASFTGAVAGIVLSQYLTSLVQRTMGMVFLYPFEAAPLRMSITEIIVAIVLGTTAAVVASLYPSIRAARVNAIAVIKNRGGDTEEGTHDPRGFLVAALAVGLMVAAAVWFEVRWRSFFLGNIASMGCFVAFILLAVPVTTCLARSLADPLSRWLRAPGEFAAAMLSISANKSAVAVSILSLAVATQMTFAGLLWSFEESLAEYVELLVSGDLVVASTHSQGGWLEKPISSEFIPEIESVTGVSQVDAFRLVPGVRVNGERSSVMALSAGLLSPHTYGRWFLSGDAREVLAEVRGDGVMISETFAHLNAVDVGDHLSIATPNGVLERPVLAVVVDYTSDRGAVIMSLDTYRKHWNDQHVSRINVHIDSDAKPELVRGEIRGTLKDDLAFKVTPLPELLDWHREQVRGAFGPAGAIKWMLLLVTVAGIIDTVIANVMDRRRDLALMRSAGATRNQVFQTVMIGVGILIAAGLLSGVVCGTISAWLWVRFHFTYLLGWILEFHFPWIAAGQAVVLSALVAVAAAIVPARRAANADVISILHCN